MPSLTALTIFVVPATGEEGIQEESKARFPFRGALAQSGYVHQLTATVCTVAPPINAATTTNGGFPHSDVPDDGTDAFANARSQRSPWGFERRGWR
jgi:hypothetical protein